MHCASTSKQYAQFERFCGWLFRRGSIHIGLWAVFIEHPHVYTTGELWPSRAEFQVGNILVGWPDMFFMAEQNIFTLFFVFFQCVNMIQITCVSVLKDSVCCNICLRWHARCRKRKLASCKYCYKVHSIQLVFFLVGDFWGGTA